MNPFQTIQREDVGVTLKVTPKVSTDTTITLEIEQEVESVREEQIANAQDLVTDKRSIKTNVMVDNNSILVLGGLLEDRVTLNKSKVPILGDIPLLGRLFTNSSKSTRKQNLMVFIQPRILTNEEISDEVTEDKYNIIRNKQIQKNKRSAFTPLPEFDQRDSASSAVKTNPISD